MFASILLGAVGVVEVLLPRRVVDLWFALATEQSEDGDVARDSHEHSWGLLQLADVFVLW